jgi:hypothetical protein
MKVEGGLEERAVGLFVVICCPWFGNSWVKVDFKHCGVVVR